MNRQQRRRADRAAAKYDPETRMMVTPLGHRFRAERVVDLPPKAPGLHRWIVSCAYTVTDEEAVASFDPDAGPQVLMGPDRLVSFGIACWDCELAYSHALARARCAG